MFIQGANPWLPIHYKKDKTKLMSILKDFNEDIGWTIFGCTFIICLTVIVYTALNYCTKKNTFIAECIKSGANPIEVSIAYDNIYTEKALSYFVSKK